LFCYKCGTQLDESSMFCSRCGAQVGALAGPAEEVSPKSRLVVTLLACPFLVVGMFGAHRFYMGKIKTAAGMLVLGLLAAVGYFGYMGAIMTATMNIDEEEFPVALFLLFGVAWLFGMAAGIWALVDFILAVSGKFKDNEGRPITKW
jgi:TM2 domain-containing membrane protein YozV